MQTSERLTINLPEFARLAGISKNQAYKLATTNSLGVPVIRLGKRIVLPRRAAMALLEGEAANSIGGPSNELS